VIAASSTAFAVVKWVGVAYLVWLGIKQFRAPIVAPSPELPPSSSPSSSLSTSNETSQSATALPSAAKPETGLQLFLRGWMVNSFNPKGTVFLLAVVPQFLDLTRALPLQYLVIGATLGFTDLVVMAGYTALAAKVLGLLRSPRQLKAMNRVFGSLFVGAGIVLSLFKRS
jgi:homoserine/homoserine lactone efflux protein